MDAHSMVTRVVNVRLNRAVALLRAEGGRRGAAVGFGRAARGEWGGWLRAAALLEEWRDWLARQGVWDAGLCRVALGRLAPIVLGVEGLEGAGEAYGLLLEMAGELEASVGLEGYFEGLLARLRGAGEGERGASRGPRGGAGGSGEGGGAPRGPGGRRELSVHYMVTRIVNPRVNRLLPVLRGSRAVWGRDGYTRVRWRVFSDGDYVASLLETWVEDIWRGYRDGDLVGRGGELLDSLLRVVAEAEARLGDGLVVGELWELARDLEAYLGVEGYLEAARPWYEALVEGKREERRRVAEALRRSQRSRGRRGGSRGRRAPVGRVGYVSRGGVARGAGRAARWAVALFVVLAVLVVAAVYGPALVSGPGGSQLQLPGRPVCGQGSYYTLGEALRCYLSRPGEASLLRGLAARLRGGGLAESAWNVLAWEEGHLGYDWGRRDALVGGVSLPVQPPSVTVERGRGVCVDYAVLTAGILAYMGYPVYVFEMNFTGPGGVVGHAAAAVRIGGEYYMLDQRLPPLPLGAYYDYWAYYREGVYEGHRLENLRVREARVYRVYVSGGRVEVEEVGVLSASQFRGAARRATGEELEELAGRLALLMRERHPNLVLDSGLGRGPGVLRWEFRFPVLAEAYSPVFADEYVEWLYGEMTGSARFAGDLVRYRRLWVECRAVGDSLVVDVYLASP